MQRTNVEEGQLATLSHQLAQLNDGKRVVDAKHPSTANCCGSCLTANNFQRNEVLSKKRLKA